MDVRAPTARQQPGQREDDQDHADHRDDGPRGVPDQAADGQREQAEHGQVQAGPDHRPQHAGLAQRHGDRVMHGDNAARDLQLFRDDVPVHQRDADEERHERDDLADDDDQRREDQALGQHHRVTARHGQQRGPDRAGGVLAGDHQHPQGADGKLAQPQPGAEDEVHRIGDDTGRPRIAAAVVQRVDRQPGEQGGEPQADDDEDDQRPDRGPDRADLRPLGQQVAAKARPMSRGRSGREGGWGGGWGADGGHWLLPGDVAPAVS